MQNSQKALMARFSLFCGDLCGNFTKNGTNLRPGQFFWGFQPFRTLCGHQEYLELPWGLRGTFHLLHLQDSQDQGTQFQLCEG